MARRDIRDHCTVRLDPRTRTELDRLADGGARGARRSRSSLIEEMIHFWLIAHGWQGGPRDGWETPDVVPVLDPGAICRMVA